jgi:hypothetical protein
MEIAESFGDNSIKQPLIWVKEPAAPKPFDGAMKIDNDAAATPTRDSL